MSPSLYEKTRVAPRQVHKAQRMYGGESEARSLVLNIQPHDDRCTGALEFGCSFTKMMEIHNELPDIKSYSTHQDWFLIDEISSSILGGSIECLSTPTPPVSCHTIVGSFCLSEAAAQPTSVPACMSPRVTQSLCWFMSCGHTPLPSFTLATSKHNPKVLTKSKAVVVREAEIYRSICTVDLLDQGESK